MRLANLKNILNSNQLESTNTFKIDGLGSKTMADTTPRGGFQNTNFFADENQTLSHRNHTNQRRSPVMKINTFKTTQTTETSPRKDNFQF